MVEINIIGVIGGGLPVGTAAGMKKKKSGERRGVQEKKKQGTVTRFKQKATQCKRRRGKARRGGHGGGGRGRLV